MAASKLIAAVTVIHKRHGIPAKQDFASLSNALAWVAEQEQLGNLWASHIVLASPRLERDQFEALLP